MKKKKDMTKRTLLFLTLAEVGSYTMVNKFLIKLLGLNAAFLLCELISLQSYFAERNMLQEDGAFYLAKSEFNKNVSLKRSKLDRAMAILTKHNLITMYEQTGQANRFILNEGKITELLLSPEVCLLEADHHALNRQSTQSEINREPCIIQTPNNNNIINLKSA
ncbi:MAG TPA: hypothetical protein VHO03_08090 [Ignavibacteriales bacterium]|nr:hypothetical protein [Ignavibacteriales bacterium]